MSEKNLLRCSVDQHEYTRGSFSDLVHTFLASPPGLETERIGSARKLFQFTPWGVDFFPGLIWELEKHFGEFLATIKSGNEIFNDPFRSWVQDKWDAVGIALLEQGRNELAEAVYERLLTVQRNFQEQFGWIPKGTALYHLGLAKLASGRPAERTKAEPYFLAALVEDILFEVTRSMPEGRYMQYPAFRILKAVYQHDDRYLAKFKDGVIMHQHGRTTDVVDQLFVMNPELLVMEFVGRTPREGWADVRL